MALKKRILISQESIKNGRNYCLFCFLLLFVGLLLFFFFWLALLSLRPLDMKHSQSHHFPYSLDKAHKHQLVIKMYNNNHFKFRRLLSNKRVTGILNSFFFSDRLMRRERERRRA